MLLGVEWCLTLLGLHFPLPGMATNSLRDVGSVFPCWIWECEFALLTREWRDMLLGVECFPSVDLTQLHFPRAWDFQQQFNICRKYFPAGYGSAWYLPSLVSAIGHYS